METGTNVEKSDLKDTRIQQWLKIIMIAFIYS